MPRAGDSPQFDVRFLEIPSETGPLGVKDSGESGSAGGIPATALAVRGAEWRARVDGIETPFTPMRLRAARHGAP